MSEEKYPVKFNTSDFKMFCQEEETYMSPDRKIIEQNAFYVNG
jgi:hypothetical protein